MRKLGYEKDRSFCKCTYPVLYPSSEKRKHNKQESDCFFRNENSVAEFWGAVPTRESSVLA